MCEREGKITRSSDVEEEEKKISRERGRKIEFERKGKKHRSREKGEEKQIKCEKE